MESKFTTCSLNFALDLLALCAFYRMELSIHLSAPSILLKF